MNIAVANRTTEEQQMRTYQEILEWADTLYECGLPGEVGTGMVKTLKETIREAYRQGREDQRKGLPARRNVPRGSLRGR